MPRGMAASSFVLRTSFNYSVVRTDTVGSSGPVIGPRLERVKRGLDTTVLVGPGLIGLSRPDSKSSDDCGLHRLLEPRSSRWAAPTMIDRNRRGTRPTTYSRKEVIQPQVPLRLPCYDFTPVTSHSLGGYLRSWRTDF
jgi:hypothetical protein